MKGEQITSLQDLWYAVYKKQYVAVPEVFGLERIPAVFVINMQAKLVLWWFNKGMYIYKKGEKE